MTAKLVAWNRYRLQSTHKILVNTDAKDDGIHSTRKSKRPDRRRGLKRQKKTLLPKTSHLAVISEFYREDDSSYLNETIPTPTRSKPDLLYYNENSPVSQQYEEEVYSEKDVASEFSCSSSLQLHPDGFDIIEYVTSDSIRPGSCNDIPSVISSSSSTSSASLPESMPFKFARRHDGSRKVIGKGAFSIVYEGLFDSNSVSGNGENSCKKVAIKISNKQLPLVNGRVEGQQEFEVREMLTMKNLVHENIVRVLECGLVKLHLRGLAKVECSCVVVMEYMPYTLTSFIQSDKFRNISRGIKHKIIIGIANGLKYLKDNHIMHRDLKSDNILINDVTMVAKISDFNLSKVLEDDFVGQHSTGLGTRGYKAPEIITGVYDHKIDVWAFGCVLYQLVAGQRHPKANTYDMLNEVCSDSLYYEILRRCFDENPETRIEIEDVLRLLCES